MTAENYDGYAHVHELMSRALKEETTQDEIKELYAAWSKTYDKNSCTINSYSGPTAAAEQLTQKLKEFGYTEDARIMDLGCGTGLVGVELRKRGYKNIDGVDLVPEMLEHAKAKGVYRSLQQGSMGSPGCKDLGVDANQYDAVICVGVLVAGQVNGEGLHDLDHVVKPGGLVCFSIRDFALDAAHCGYGEKLGQFCQKGKWKLLTKHYVSKYYEEGSAWCFVYQKL